MVFCDPGIRECVEPRADTIDFPPQVEAVQVVAGNPSREKLPRSEGALLPKELPDGIHLGHFSGQCDESSVIIDNCQGIIAHKADWLKEIHGWSYQPELVLSDSR
jgi:hypothetical protein